MYDHYQAFEKVRDPKTYPWHIPMSMRFKERSFQSVERFILKENEAQWLEEVVVN